MPEDLDQAWTTALLTTHQWLDQTGIGADKSRLVSCCEDEEQVREWSLPANGSTVSVTLIRAAEQVMLQVYAKTLTLPEAVQPSFYEVLLRLNATTLSCCAFGVDEDNAVVVVADRAAQGMHADDISALVEAVSKTATQHRDTLSESVAAS
jgi:hypothetical protein